MKKYTLTQIRLQYKVLWKGVWGKAFLSRKVSPNKYPRKVSPNKYPRKVSPNKYPRKVSLNKYYAISFKAKSVSNRTP